MTEKPATILEQAEEAWKQAKYVEEERVQTYRFLFKFNKKTTRLYSNAFQAKAACLFHLRYQCR